MPVPKGITAAPNHHRGNAKRKYTQGLLCAKLKPEQAFATDQEFVLTAPR